MSEKCDRCGLFGSDRRTIRMSCLYAMEELGIPLKKEDDGYRIVCCKRCRAEWMSAIKQWFNAPPQGIDHDADIDEPQDDAIGSGIFVRELGCLREVSREEWDKNNPGLELVVVRR